MEESDSLAQEVKNYSRKVFIKRGVSRILSQSRFQAHLSISKADEASQLIKNDTSQVTKLSHFRSRSNPNKLHQSVFSDIPTSSDLAVKKARKRVDPVIELARKINEKATQNKQFGLGDIFGALGINLDEGTLQLLKNTFSFATNMVSMSKEIAKTHFSYIPVFTRLHSGFGVDKLNVFSKELSKFVCLFIDKLRKSYILHKPELALSCKLQK